MKFEVPAIDHFQLLSSCECNPNVIPACFLLENSDGIWTARLWNPFSSTSSSKPPNSEAPGAAAPAPAWEAAPAMASSVATAVATGPTRERWKGWKGRKGRMLRNASDDYLVKWLVGLFGLVFFVWLCSDVGLCFACFCLFVWLVGWLVVYCG